MKLTTAVSLALFVSIMSAAYADPPNTRPVYTLPYTGGYGTVSPPPETPHNVPPAMGGSVGIQYPPDPGPTKVNCTRDGVPVPC